MCSHALYLCKTLKAFMKQNTHRNQELAKFKHETERVWERSECNYPVELPSLFLLDLDYLFTKSTHRPPKSCGIVFGLAGTELIPHCRPRRTVLMFAAMFVSGHHILMGRINLFAFLCFQVWPFLLLIKLPLSQSVSFSSYICSLPCWGGGGTEKLGEHLVFS